jgi:prepilin-type N-terminal cleavage/methylation domain-containing protein
MGAWVRHSREERAFTLLEVLVSLTILSIMMAVVIPNLGPMRLRGQLRTSARNVAHLIRYGRMHAVYNHATVKIRIDTEKHMYRLDLMEKGIPANERRGEISVVEEIHALPPKIRFDEVTLYGGEINRHRGTVVLECNPRGSVTAATIVLSDVKGQKMTLEVFSTTGAIEVYRGEPVERSER